MRHRDWWGRGWAAPEDRSGPERRHSRAKVLKQSRDWYVGGAAGSQSGYREMSKQKAANRRLRESRFFRKEVWISF